MAVNTQFSIGRFTSWPRWEFWDDRGKTCAELAMSVAHQSKFCAIVRCQSYLERDSG